VKRYKTYWHLAGFAVLYITIMLVMPSNPETVAKYQLTNLPYRVLLLSVVALPAILTWLAAFYGYEQLRRYAKSVRSSREGDAFAILSRGSKMIAYFLPTVLIISLILRAFANANHSFNAAAIVITNYVTIATALIAFGVIGRGARAITDSHKPRTRPSRANTLIGMFVYLTLVVLYCYIIFSHSLHDPNPYHLPVSLLIVTVIIPFLYAWFMGLQAALDIWSFGQGVAGILYQRALQYLAGGLFLVIVVMILLQYIDSANTERGNLTFGWVLLMRDILYIGLIIGFALIGYSAKKLRQIEKV